MALSKDQYFSMGKADAQTTPANRQGHLYAAASWQGKAYTMGYQEGAAIAATARAPGDERRRAAQAVNMAAPSHDCPACAAGLPLIRHVGAKVVGGPDAGKTVYIAEGTLDALLAGAVALSPVDQRRADRIDAITKGYLIALAWSTGETHPETGEELEDLEDFEFSDEARAAARRVCAAFFAKNETDLGAYAALRVIDTGTSHSNRPLIAYEYAGHDLWLDSQGHGVGFWDRGLGGLGKRLSAASKAFAAVYPELGDDLQIHISGAACN